MHAQTIDWIKEIWQEEVGWPLMKKTSAIFSRHDPDPGGNGRAMLMAVPPASWTRGKPGPDAGPTTASCWVTPDFWSNTFYSLYLAAASLLATVVGTLTAYGIATSEATPLRRLSERVMQAGLVLPYLYAVFLAFLLLGQAGLLSRLALALGLIDSQAFPGADFRPRRSGDDLGLRL
jgi:hypothetical protein